MFSMEKEKLVVDANVIIASLLKDSFARKSLLKQKRYELITPEFVNEEIIKYLPELAIKAKLSEKNLKSFMKEFFVAAGIIAVPVEAYFEKIGEALEISPDKKDAPYFALALKMNCGIYTYDKELRKQAEVKIVSSINDS